MRIEGAAALVTGAGSGLGAATARALAAGGARVALLDRDADAARAVAAETGGLALACDVTSAEGAEAAVAQAAAAHGAARVLVNCAGVAPAQKIMGRAGLMPLDDFRRAVEINLIGTFNMLRLFVGGAAALDPMEDGERGVVVNVASIAAFEGQIGQSAYAASKAGVVGLTLPAARELAPLGVRVCCVAPGVFETAMLRGLPEAAQESLGKAAPFPARLGRPEEFAALVLHILGNRMLNGETIRLDAAMRMGAR